MLWANVAGECKGSPRYRSVFDRMRLNVATGLQQPPRVRKLSLASLFTREPAQAFESAISRSLCLWIRAPVGNSEDLSKLLARHPPGARLTIRASSRSTAVIVGRLKGHHGDLSRTAITEPLINKLFIFASSTTHNMSHVIILSYSHATRHH